MKSYYHPADAEIPYAGEVPLTPNVRPAIVVGGSDYDIGYQWYQQTIQIFGRKPIEERLHRKFSSKDISTLKAYQWHIRNNVPYMIDLLKGMVAGAKDAGISLTYEELLAKWALDPFESEAELFQRIASLSDEEKKKRSATDSFPIPPESEDETLPPEEDCSGFAAWGKTTKDGSLICAGNGDHQIILGINEINNFECVVAVFPEKGNNYVFSTSTGCCWHPGMNNKGVAYYHHGCTGYYRRYKKPEEQNFGYGVPNTMITLHALRYANTALEAQELVLSLPSGDGRIGGGWADVNGNAFVIENRDNPRCIRKPGDNGETDFIYSTNNLFSKELKDAMNPPPGGNVFIPHGGWLGTAQTISSVQRNLQLWNLLHNYQGHVDLDFAKMMYRFTGAPPDYPTLEEADAAFFPKQGKGWHYRIGSLKSSMIGVLKPDNGNNGLYFVSNGCPGRDATPGGPGGHYYRIAPTYSFYELKLDSDWVQMAGSAKKRAQYYLYYANQELRKLNYGDVAYAPLDDLFNQAAVEWQKGEYFRGRAQSTRGNESVNFWGKTFRSLSRCQALARQVYNALIPPPAKPEDLGLRPWGYWNNEYL